MAYTPSKDTIQNLRDLYELEGSYKATAESLNKGRRSDSQQFTEYQIKQMLKRDRVRDEGAIGGWSYRNDPKPIRMSSAQQRSLQRKAKVESGTYKSAFKDYKEEKRSTKAYDKIKANIDAKRERLKKERRKYMKAGQTKEANALLKQIQALDDFDNSLDNAKDSATTYKKWKALNDGETP
tara:strand:- start:5562 stop:6104 length:543 start_codon:yes stop_codon:yes gene_type:complete